MIKDIVLALEVGAARDAARDYAISVSALFNAHIAAIGFAYAPTLPPADTVSAVPFDILDAERETNRKAASDAIARFEEAARLAAVSAESRLVEASVSGATNVFGSIARTFDLSVVGQAEPKSMRDDLMIEGALFDSGRPVLVVPYPAGRPQARPRHGLLGRWPQCRTRDQRRHAVSLARQGRRRAHYHCGQAQERRN